MEGAIAKGASIFIENGKIKSLDKISPPRGADIIDAKGLFVSPGFIDSHIHGDPAKIISNEVRFGTTGVVIAESCAPLGSIYKRIDLVKRFIKESPLGGCVLGVRLEGPYISKVKAGAQDKRYIKKPDRKELSRIIKRCGPSLKIMTIAPELKGASTAIKMLNKKGIVSSIGHTNATYKAALKGIDEGITHATHLFNAMSGKYDLKGCAGACLDSPEVIAEIIADLIHVRKELISIALNRKSPDKVILVTDSIRHTLYAKRYKIEDGVYRLRDGTIAGSSLTMIEAVKNAALFPGIGLKGAVAFATINPARLLGVDAFKGSIARGKDADLVIFDKDFDVKMTMVRGRIIHRKRGF